jgi:putative endonuclease
MFYTYVLKSRKDDALYYGYTEDLAQRFEEHNKGRVESTKNRRPFILLYYEACTEKRDALKREKYFKSYRGRQFLHNRLKSYFTGLPKEPR